MKKILLSFVLIFVFSFSAFSDDFVCTAEYQAGKKLETTDVETVTYKRINNDSYNATLGQDVFPPFDIIFEDEFILVLSFSYAESNEASFTMTTLIKKDDLTFGLSAIILPYDNNQQLGNQAGTCIKL